jgi:hypothetical protein
MHLDIALDWIAQRTVATLITIRSDGRPQSSDIAYRIHDGQIVISLTETRAKTRNIAELSAVTTRPGDATSDALVEYYEGVTGEAHPDWDEYRQAMVAERRLLATITPNSVVGQIR